MDGRTRTPDRVRIGLIGLGKMGISHCALLRAHPEVDLAAICDSSTYVTGVLSKYTGLRAFTDHETMLRDADIDAVVIATPSASHVPLATSALERGIDVFCEKPLALTGVDAERLTALAHARGRVTQVGYHNRYIAMFAEARRLLDAGALGRVTHVLGEAYGPVVLKPSAGTWRTRRSEGGGCLHDYAAHVVDLITWYLGEPTGVGGSTMNSVHSKDTEDEVFSTLFYPGGRTAQVSVNWSDESQRKMSTKLSVWGTHGRISVSRQDCEVYLRSTAAAPAGYEHGWNVRHTTDAVDDVYFYLRGEEYSAQIADFVSRVKERRLDGRNTFASAAVTDSVLSLMAGDAKRGFRTQDMPAPAVERGRPRLRWLRQLQRRATNRQLARST